MKKLFKNFGVGKKISALLIISVIVVVLIAVGFAIIRFMNLMQEQSIEQAIKGVQGLEQQISVRRDNANGVAYLLSLNSEVGAGIAAKDRIVLKQVSDKMIKDTKTDFIIFTDKNGNVFILLWHVLIIVPINRRRPLKGGIPSVGWVIKGARQVNGWRHDPGGCA